MTFPFPPSVVLVVTFAAILSPQVDCAPSCNLRAIFRTPRKNTDEFEILERSNFDSDSDNQDSQPKKPEDPRSYANAQISLKFNDPPTRQCSCGENCQCRNQHYRQQPPVIYPIPIFIAPYHLPPQQYQNPPQSKQNESPSNDRKQQGGTMETAINNDNGSPVVPHDNHPEIMKDVEVSIQEGTEVTNDKIGDDIHRKQLKEEIARTIEGAPPGHTKIEFSPLDSKNVKPETKQTNEKLRLEVSEALVPYMANTMTRPKQLVTFPVFNKQSNREEVWGKNAYQVGGYSVDPRGMSGGYNMVGGGGYYSNPLQGLGVYKQPTLLSLLIPSHYPLMTHGGYEDGRSRGGYVLTNDNQQHVNDVEEVDCQCNCCTKYEKELNE